MDFFQTLLTGVIAALVFAAIDLVWLTTVARNFYHDRLGHLLRDKANGKVGALFYVLNIVGLCYFAIVPAINNDSLSKALLNGALYGLFTYATYDLTNLSTIKNWSRAVSIVDIAWGTALSATVAAITYMVMGWIL